MDDKKKPYKMYAAMLSAFIGSFLLTNSTDLPTWAVGLLTGLVAAISVFYTPNPKVNR